MATCSLNSTNPHYECISKYFVNTIHTGKYIRPKKITNFKIPMLSEYHDVIEQKLTVKNLIEIKRFYEIKCNNRKDELLFFVFNILRLRCSVHIISTSFFKYKKRQYFSLISLNTNDEFINTEDFATLEPIEQINAYNLFEFNDLSDEINRKPAQKYGFDISSFNKLINSSSTVLNPYTRKVIPNHTINNFNMLLKIRKLLKIPSFKNDPPPMSDMNKLKFKMQDLFHDINNLGNYADPVWLEQLDNFGMIKFITELMDLWEYRANLSNEMKFSIYNRGNPFYDVRINVMRVNSDIRNKNLICNIIKRFISSPNHENAALGAFYVLGVLTLVNNSAAEALPWLFESFFYPNNSN